MNYFYFDNAATTRVRDGVREIVEMHNHDAYYNPSANYLPAIEVHNEIESVRASILKSIKGFGGNLYFTSSGTEADNLALFGSKKRKGCNVVISAVEHPAVYNAANALKDMGVEVRIAPVNGAGAVDAEAFGALIDENTSLASVMHVNNETGALNDVKNLCALAKRKNPRVLFHSDGVQALGKTPVNLSELGVDYYTISGHKIGAPKGVAALYVAKGRSISPILYGGGQEDGVRSSTENVGGILSFGYAVSRSVEELADLTVRYREFAACLRDKLSTIDDIRFLSDEECISGILTFAFKDLRGEAMQHALSAEGYLVGTGSACSARRANDRIRNALGLDKAYSGGVIRVSFGRDNTIEQVEGLGDAVLAIYRNMKKYIRK